MNRITHILHYMQSIFMPSRHREQALIEIERFEEDVDALYVYMSEWYPYFLHDIEIMASMVRHHGRVIKYFPALQQIRLFVLDAVRNDGRALQYCVPFQEDWEVVFEAVSQTGYAFKYASDDIRHDIDMMCCCLESTPVMLNTLPISASEYRNTVLAISIMRSTIRTSDLCVFSERVQRLASAVYKHNSRQGNERSDDTAST